MTDRMIGENESNAGETDRSDWTPADYQAEIARLRNQAEEADRVAKGLRGEQRWYYEGKDAPRRRVVD